MDLKSALRSRLIRFRNKNQNMFGSEIQFDKTVLLGKGIKIGSRSILTQNVHIHKDAIIGGQVYLSRIEIGERSHIEFGVICTGYGSGKILVGKESYIGIYNVLDWSDNLTIGNYVHIAGPSTGIWTHSSVQQALAGDALSDKRKRTTDPIVIEDCVYIGGNCTIYPGVKIGHHSVVAPNSAVADDVQPHTMVGGVPAKVIKKLDH